MKVSMTKGIQGACEDCAFFKDCPMGYFCPPAEIIAFLMDEQQKGRVKLLFREDLEKEVREQEE